MSYFDQLRTFDCFVNRLHRHSRLPDFLGELTTITFPEEFETALLASLKKVTREALENLKHNRLALSSFMKSNFGLSILPRDILVSIFQDVGTVDLFSLCAVNKDFKTTIMDPRQLCFVHTKIHFHCYQYHETQLLPGRTLSRTTRSGLAIHLLDNHHKFFVKESEQISHALSTIVKTPGCETAVPRCYWNVQNPFPAARNLFFESPVLDFQANPISRVIELAEEDGEIFAAHSIRNVVVTDEMPLLTTDDFPDLDELVVSCGRGSIFWTEDDWLDGDVQNYLPGSILCGQLSTVRGIELQLIYYEKEDRLLLVDDVSEMQMIYLVCMIAWCENLEKIRLTVRFRNNVRFAVHYLEDFSDQDMEDFVTEFSCENKLEDIIYECKFGRNMKPKLCEQARVCVGKNLTSYLKRFGYVGPKTSVTVK